MANLEFYDKHNMVRYLKKPTGSEGFQEIVDFLNGSHIRYALTTNPTIYVSLIKKFWQTATVKTVDNGEQEITATVDGKEFTVTEASVRRHLQLADVEATKGKGSRHPSEPQPPPSTAEPTNEEPIPTVVSSSHQKTQTPRQVLKEVTELPQTSEPISNVPDKAVYEEWDDRVGRATTTAASLDAVHASGGSPRCQEAMRGSIAQTRSEKVKKLEQTIKTSQARRRAKIIVSDDEKDLEYSSKQGRKINEIDQDPDITLVQHDVEIQGRYGQEIEFETKVYTAKDVSTTSAAVTTAGASISTASPPRVSTAEDISTVETLVYIRRSAAKDKDLIEDKEIELWVELKRLFEPDVDDELWKSQKHVHDITWRLYDTCRVHHVSTKDGIDIYMLVEKEYPFFKRCSYTDVGSKSLVGTK
ncbi:hypothetical protein Tco_0396760 [Tanacetum coccineum]